MVLNSPFTKTLYIDFPPLLLWSSLSELSEMLPAVLILPQIKLNSKKKKKKKSTFKNRL